MEELKENYSVARVVTHTKDNINKFERHNERKNKTYSNMNIHLDQTQNNVYYKKCNCTLNEKVKQMVTEGKISLRGLRENAKIFDELVFDVNSDYFEQNGGYEFAKKFYEQAFHFAEKEMGTDNVLSAVMHADELNIALSERYGKPIYHYHLHVIALPVVKKEIKWSKRCKDKSLVGKVRETINQVSHSKKWKSVKATDERGNFLYDNNGKVMLIKSYSLLQDRFFQYMSDNGYKGFLRGIKGSDNRHLETLDFKIKKDNEKIEEISQNINKKNNELTEINTTLDKLDDKFDEYEKYQTDLKELNGIGKQKKLSKKIEVEPQQFETLIGLANKGIVADRKIKSLEEKVESSYQEAHRWKEKYFDLKEQVSEFLDALKIAPQKLKSFISEIIQKEKEKALKAKIERQKAKEQAKHTSPKKKWRDYDER